MQGWTIHVKLGTCQNTKGGERPGEKDNRLLCICTKLINIAYSPHTPTLTPTHLDNNIHTLSAHIMLAACFKQAI
jgi:hypothetical protein